MTEIAVTAKDRVHDVRISPGVFRVPSGGPPDQKHHRPALAQQPGHTGLFGVDLHRGHPRLQRKHRNALIEREYCVVRCVTAVQVKRQQAPLGGLGFTRGYLVRGEFVREHVKQVVHAVPVRFAGVVDEMGADESVETAARGS